MSGMVDYRRELLIYDIKKIHNYYTTKKLEEYSTHQLQCLKDTILCGIPLKEHPKLMELASHCNYSLFMNALRIMKL